MGKTKPGDDVQKLKSRVAAKTRRKNENDQFNELVLMNPWITSSPPDKSTVIRLTTSYIGLLNILRNSRHSQLIEKEHSSVPGIEQLCLEALDGFLIFLSKEGRVTYVNAKVSAYLGYSENEIVGKSIYNFVLQNDWEVVARNLKGPLPSYDNPNIRQPDVDDGDEICKLSGLELAAPYFDNINDTGEQNQKVQFSVRVQCNVVRRGNSRNTAFQVLRFSGCIGTTGDFAGLVQPVWSPDIGDLPINQSVFISYLSPDLKLLFCEGRIHRFMDSEAKDIVGRVVYPFYHPQDLFHIQKLHSKLLAKGQCSTEPYRWMNKDGGWVWMKSRTRQIKCAKSGRPLMLNVNYVLSAVENKGVVVGINPATDEKVVEKDRKEVEQDSNDAYLYDPQVIALTQNMEECKITEVNNNLLKLEAKHKPDPKCETISNILYGPTASTPHLSETPSTDPDFPSSQNFPLPGDPQHPLIDSGNELNEDPAYNAAQFFMSDEAEFFLDSQSSNTSTCTLANMMNMSSSSAMPCTSPTVTDLLSNGQNESVNDYTSCDLKTNFRNSNNHIPTPSFNGVVNQPDNTDIKVCFNNTMEDGNPDFNNLLIPYLLDFNTQYLNETWTAD